MGGTDRDAGDNRLDVKAGGTRSSNTAYVDETDIEHSCTLKGILQRIHSVAAMPFELGESFQVTECAWLVAVDCCKCTVMI